MYLPAIHRWRIWTFWASTGTFYKKFRFFISFGKCVSVFSKICNRELYVEKRYAKYLLILCHTQCQIMYKWILKKKGILNKREYLGPVWLADVWPANLTYTWLGPYCQIIIVVHMYLYYIASCNIETNSLLSLW